MTYALPEALAWWALLTPEKIKEYENAYYLKVINAQELSAYDFVDIYDEMNRLYMFVRYGVVKT